MHRGVSGSTVEKRCVRGYDVVENGQAEAGRLGPVQAGHEIAHVEGGVDPADELRPTLGDVFVRLAPDEYRQVHDEPGRCVSVLIDNQPDLAGYRRHAGIASLLHRQPAHRVGPGVEARCGGVTADIGLTLDDRGIGIALACGANDVIRETAPAHGGDMGILALCRRPFDDADGLDAGKIGIEPKRMDVVAQSASVGRAGDRKQPLDAAEHLHVGIHALLDPAHRIVHGEIKLRTQRFAGGLAFVIPSQPRNAQGDGQDQPVQRKGACGRSRFVSSRHSEP